MDQLALKKKKEADLNKETNSLLQNQQLLQEEQLQRSLDAQERLQLNSSDPITIQEHKQRYNYNLNEDKQSDFIEENYRHSNDNALLQKQYSDQLSRDKYLLDKAYDITDNFGTTKPFLTEHQQAILTSNALAKGDVSTQDALNSLNRQKNLHNQLLEHQNQYDKTLALNERNRQSQYDKLGINRKYFEKELENNIKDMEYNVQAMKSLDDYQRNEVNKLLGLTVDMSNANFTDTYTAALKSSAINIADSTTNMFLYGLHKLAGNDNATFKPSEFFKHKLGDNYNSGLYDNPFSDDWWDKLNFRKISMAGVQSLPYLAQVAVDLYAGGFIGSGARQAVKKIVDSAMKSSMKARAVGDIYKATWLNRFASLTMDRAIAVGIGGHRYGLEHAKERQEIYGGEFDYTLRDFLIGSAEAGLDVAGLEGAIRLGSRAWKNTSKNLENLVSKNTIKDLSKRIVKSAGLGFVAEGVTEGIQTVLENMAKHNIDFTDMVSILTDDDPKYTNLRHEILDSMLVGGLMGGLLGSAGGMVKSGYDAYQNNKLNNKASFVEPESKTTSNVDLDNDTQVRATNQAKARNINEHLETIDFGEDNKIKKNIKDTFSSHIDIFDKLRKEFNNPESKYDKKEIEKKLREQGNILDVGEYILTNKLNKDNVKEILKDFQELHKNPDNVYDILGKYITAEDIENIYKKKREDLEKNIPQEEGKENIGDINDKGSTQERKEKETTFDEIINDLEEENDKKEFHEKNETKIDPIDVIKTKEKIKELNNTEQVLKNSIGKDNKSLIKNFIKLQNGEDLNINDLSDTKELKGKTKKEIREHFKEAGYSDKEIDQLDIMNHSPEPNDIEYGNDTINTKEIHNTINNIEKELKNIIDNNLNYTKTSDEKYLQQIKEAKERYNTYINDISTTLDTQLKNIEDKDYNNISELRALVNSLENVNNQYKKILEIQDELLRSNIKEENLLQRLKSGISQFKFLSKLFKDFFRERIPKTRELLNNLSNSLKDLQESMNNLETKLKEIDNIINNPKDKIKEYHNSSITDIPFTLNAKIKIDKYSSLLDVYGLDTETIKSRVSGVLGKLLLDQYSDKDEGYNNINRNEIYRLLLGRNFKEKIESINPNYYNPKNKDNYLKMTIQQALDLAKESNRYLNENPNIQANLVNLIKIAGLSVLDRINTKSKDKNINPKEYDVYTSFDLNRSAKEVFDNILDMGENNNFITTNAIFNLATNIMSDEKNPDRNLMFISGNPKAIRFITNLLDEIDDKVTQKQNSLKEKEGKDYTRKEIYENFIKPRLDDKKNPLIKRFDTYKYLPTSEIEASKKGETLDDVLTSEFVLKNYFEKDQGKIKTIENFLTNIKRSNNATENNQAYIFSLKSINGNNLIDDFQRKERLSIDDKILPISTDNKHYTEESRKSFNKETNVNKITKRKDQVEYSINPVSIDTFLDVFGYKKGEENKFIEDNFEIVRNLDESTAKLEDVKLLKNDYIDRGENIYTYKDNPNFYIPIYEINEGKLDIHHYLKIKDEPKVQGLLKKLEFEELPEYQVLGKNYSEVQSFISRTQKNADQLGELFSLILYRQDGYLKMYNSPNSRFKYLHTHQPSGRIQIVGKFNPLSNKFLRPFIKARTDLNGNSIDEVVSINELENHKDLLLDTLALTLTGADSNFNIENGKVYYDVKFEEKNKDDKVIKTMTLDKALDTILNPTNKEDVEFLDKQLDEIVKDVEFTDEPFGHFNAKILRDILNRNIKEVDLTDFTIEIDGKATGISEASLHQTNMSDDFRLPLGIYRGIETNNKGIKDRIIMSQNKAKKVLKEKTNPNANDVIEALRKDIPYGKCITDLYDTITESGLLDIETTNNPYLDYLVGLFRKEISNSKQAKNYYDDLRNMAKKFIIPLNYGSHPNSLADKTSSDSIQMNIKKTMASELIEVLNEDPNPNTVPDNINVTNREAMNQFIEWKNKNRANGEWGKALDDYFERQDFRNVFIAVCKDYYIKDLIKSKNLFTNENIQQQMLNIIKEKDLKSEGLLPLALDAFVKVADTRNNGGVIKEEIAKEYIRQFWNNIISKYGIDTHEQRSNCINAFRSEIENRIRNLKLHEEETGINVSLHKSEADNADQIKQQKTILNELKDNAYMQLQQLNSSRRIGNSAMFVKGGLSIVDTCITNIAANTEHSIEAFVLQNALVNNETPNIIDIYDGIILPIRFMKKAAEGWNKGFENIKSNTMMFSQPDLAIKKLEQFPIDLNDLNNKRVQKILTHLNDLILRTNMNTKSSFYNILYPDMPSNPTESNDFVIHSENIETIKKKAELYKKVLGEKAFGVLDKLPKVWRDLANGEDVDPNMKFISNYVAVSNQITQNEKVDSLAKQFDEGTKTQQDLLEDLMSLLYTPNNFNILPSNLTSHTFSTDEKRKEFIETLSKACQSVPIFKTDIKEKKELPIGIMSKYRNKNKGNGIVLEVSSQSTEDIGKILSAMNLRNSNNKTVEQNYNESKRITIPKDKVQEVRQKINNASIGKGKLNWNVTVNNNGQITIFSKKPFDNGFIAKKINDVLKNIVRQYNPIIEAKIGNTYTTDLQLAYNEIYEEAFRKLPLEIQQEAMSYSDYNDMFSKNNTIANQAQALRDIKDKWIQEMPLNPNPSIQDIQDLDFSTIDNPNNIPEGPSVFIEDNNHIQEFNTRPETQADTQEISSYVKNNKPKEKRMNWEEYIENSLEAKIDKFMNDKPTKEDVINKIKEILDKYDLPDDIKRKFGNEIYLSAKAQQYFERALHDKDTEIKPSDIDNSILLDKERYFKDLRQNVHRMNISSESKDYVNNMIKTLESNIPDNLEIRKSNTIDHNGAFISDGKKNILLLGRNVKDTTRLHELIHAGTVKAITSQWSNAKTFVSKIDKIRKFVEQHLETNQQDLERLGLLDSNGNRNKTYSDIFHTPNIEEFVAHFLSDPNKLSYLEQFNMKQIYKGTRPKAQSFIGKAFNLIGDLCLFLSNLFSRLNLNNTLNYSNSAGTLVQLTSKLSDYNRPDKAYELSNGLYSKFSDIVNTSFKGILVHLLPMLLSGNEYMQRKGWTKAQIDRMKKDLLLELGNIMEGNSSKFNLLNPILYLNPMKRSIMISVFREVMSRSSNKLARELSRILHDLGLGSPHQLDTQRKLDKIINANQQFNANVQNASDRTKMYVQDLLKETLGDKLNTLEREAEDFIMPDDEKIRNDLLGRIQYNRLELFKRDLGDIIFQLRLSKGLKEDINSTISNDSIHNLMTNLLYNTKEQSLNEIKNAEKKLEQELKNFMKGYKYNPDMLTFFNNCAKDLAMGRIVGGSNDLGLTNVSDIIRQYVLHNPESFKSFKDDILKFDKGRRLQYTRMIQSIYNLINQNMIYQIKTERGLSYQRINASLYNVKEVLGIQDKLDEKSMNLFTSLLVYHNTLDETEHSKTTFAIDKELDHTIYADMNEYNELLRKGENSERQEELRKQIFNKREKNFDKYDEFFTYDWTKDYTLDNRIPYAYNPNVDIKVLSSHMTTEQLQKTLDTNSVNSMKEGIQFLKDLGYKIVDKNGKSWEINEETISEHNRGRDPDKDTILTFKYDGFNKYNDDGMSVTYIGNSTHAAGTTLDEYNLSEDAYNTFLGKANRLQDAKRKNMFKKDYNPNQDEFLSSIDTFRLFGGQGRFLKEELRNDNVEMKWGFNARTRLTRVMMDNMTDVDRSVDSLFANLNKSIFTKTLQNKLNEQLADGIISDNILLQTDPLRNTKLKNMVKIFDIGMNRDEDVNITNTFSSEMYIMLKQKLNNYNENNNTDFKMEQLYIDPVFLEQIFGVKSKKISNMVHNAEMRKRINTLTTFVSNLFNDQKQTMIIRNPRAVMANYISNFATCMSMGISLSDIGQHAPQITEDVDRYKADSFKFYNLMQERIELEGIRDKTDLDKKRLQEVTDELLLTSKRIKANRVYYPMINGVDSNIIDETLREKSDTDKFFIRMVEKPLEILGKKEIFGQLRSKIANELSLGQSSEYYVQMQRINKLGDIVPKILIYEHYLNKGVSKELALQKANDYLVNYNVPLTSKVFRMMDQSGLAFFMKWFVKTQKSSLEMFYNYPVNTMFALGAKALFNTSMIAPLAGESFLIKGFPSLFGNALRPSGFLRYGWLF